MSILRMLESHPEGPDRQTPIARAVAEAVTCAAICTSCADACVAEADGGRLERCIRLNLDCADICTVLSRVAMRRSGGVSHLLRPLLDLCASVCANCADECDEHAPMHAHCANCAEICRKCTAACRDALVGTA